MAIAFDATSSGTGGSSPRTHSHTCTGSNRILFITTNVNTASAATITVTYNGVAATQIQSQKFIGGGGSVFLHYLIAPATGANNIVVTLTSGSGNLISVASSYTGANQSSQPNISGLGGQTTTTSYSHSLTTTLDNCWSVMGGSRSSGLAITAGANTTIRGEDGGYTGLFLCDSNGPKTPAGTATLTVTSASQPFVSIMASFSPAPETRYWVGGTGTWNTSNTTNWSASSGGAGGASVPTAADNIVFDSASNATAYTVTTTNNISCLDLTFSAPTSGNVTWASNASWDISIYGSMTLYSGLIKTSTVRFNFVATTTGKNITCAGNSLLGATYLQFNGVGGGWTLQDDLDITGVQLLIYNGNFNSNGKTITCSTFDSNLSNTRTITLGASIINSTAWNLATITGLTFNVNTSSIRVTGSGVFSGGGLTYNEVQLNGTSHTLSGTNTFAILTRTGTATKTDTLTLSANQTVTGTFTATGNSAINRVLVKSDILGTARTITASAISVDKVDFQDITGAGAASWDMSAAAGYTGNCGGNSMKALGNAAFTAAATCNWSAGTTWSTATWSNHSIPLPQDTATFTTAGTVTITQDMPRIGSVDFTGSANKTWTTSTACSVFGSINLTNLTTLTASNQTYTFAGRGSYILISGGKAWGKSIDLNCPTGTYTLQDNFELNTSNGLTFTNGTFTANGYNVKFQNCYPNTGTKTINMGSGTWELVTGGGNWGFNGGTANLTVNCQTSTFKLTGTSDAAFNGGGFTYYNFWNATTSVAVITLSGNNTFTDMKIDASRTQLFTAASTNTIFTFTVIGTAGNIITLDSTTTGTFTLTAPSRNNASPVSCDYLNIQHCICPQANTWYAGANSVNNQGVATAGSGWIFTAPVVIATTNASFLFLMV